MDTHNMDLFRKPLSLFIIFLLFSCDDAIDEKPYSNQASIVTEISFPEERPGPKRIRIVPDDYHAKWVGKTTTGLQFFATQPFIPSLNGNPRKEFIAVYLWNPDGAFKEAWLSNMGVTGNIGHEAINQAFNQQLKHLGDFKPCAIEVCPFQVENWGTKFGLIYTTFENLEWVELLPGNYMAFTPPWEGEYDT